jgi:sigma-B regulation protein RsbU (phosphoserine phosphatase)
MPDAAAAPILVVDDDPVWLELLATGLREAGYELATAGNGVEALEYCRRHRLDLVIADWIMPAMDGLELCRALKEDRQLREIYFILLTAREEVADRVAGLDAGADEYMVKPCAVAELLARVRAGLRIRRLQEEVALMQWRLATRELAAALGHYMNNPLTAIANYLDLLELKNHCGTGEPSKDVIAAAHQELDRMASTIRRLVNMRDPQRIPTGLGTTMTALGE